MNYILTILTNGRRTCFARTVASLAEHLDPAPSSIYVFDDGAATGEIEVYDAMGRWGRMATYDSSAHALGQCAAMRNCMDAAAGSGHEWVLAWEDDVVLLRPLVIRDMVAVLETETHVAQMGLVRAPVGAEIEHGGFIPKDPGWYDRRSTGVPVPWAYEMRMPWIATRRNWQCAQALFSTWIPRTFPYPTEPGCETDYGPTLLSSAEPTPEFGLWGWGEAWTAHIGVERAAGAHGY